MSGARFPRGLMLAGLMLTLVGLVIVLTNVGVVTATGS